ncbi:retrotransposon protein, putative, ty1-copia subclass [Tanacetum coccineum]
MLSRLTTEDSKEESSQVFLNNDTFETFLYTVFCSMACLDVVLHSKECLLVCYSCQNGCFVALFLLSKTDCSALGRDKVTTQKIAALARQRALEKDRQTPFSAATQEVRFYYYGGKLDFVTMVVCCYQSLETGEVSWEKNAVVHIHDFSRWYIPELKRNLISLGTLEKEGYTVKMQSGKVKVINGSRVVLSGTRRTNCVYSLDGHAVAGELNASVDEKDSLAQVWHKRLGHISEAGLQVLEKQGLFGKESLGKLDFCENYVLGKSHRVRFGVGRHTTQGVIDYVHSDLWGPSQVESLGGKRYFLSIIDDYSRRVWVYILRFKHEAFGKFKEWKQLVENQTGRTVKKLRTDNGLEFCNREFEQLCIESGIARHLTVVGTPQQNGVAERMNRTLMDKVRCLLIQSGLPKTFWAEATCTAAYLINRSPSTAIEKKTPMEMWSGHPSDYEMLRIFGCVAYPHDKQGKLEPRAIKCVLLGYPEGVKGYRLYRLDGESPKIVTSRNVVFNESVMYKDTLKDSGAGDKSVEELQVEVELQRLNNHTPEEDQIDQEDGDDEDAGDQETNQPPDLTDYQLTRDREPRTRTKPLRFQDESNMAAYAFAAAEEEDTHEPLTYQEAVACEDSSKWKAAMEEEMDSLRKNKTWELVDPPAGQKLVSCKWLFKIKEGIEGVQKPRYKARLVARGFTQRAGIDYNEVFSPVVRHTSIRVILSLTACKDYELEQLDVKTAFLHGNLEEVIYMRQPPGYEQGNKVCLLKKSLYGLKQSPRQWYRRFDEYMLSNGFKRSSYDSCVYYRSYAPGEYIYLLLYVDDMLIACKSKAEIGSTKSLLKKEFDMKELGEAKKILGMEIVRDQSSKILRVSESGYVSKILNNFRIDNGKSVKIPLGGHFKLLLKDCPVRDYDVERMSKVPYANAVGSLMYLMVCTRPDIAYAVSTANVGLVYGTNCGNHVDVTGFVDSDYAKDPDKEAKYMALTEAVKEAIWLRGLLEELGIELNTVAVNCDNQGVLEAKKVKVLKVDTEHNDTDALTKVVPGLKLQHCLELLNVVTGCDAALETLPVDMEADIVVWEGILDNEDVPSDLNKGVKKRTEGTKEETGDGLYVKGRSDHSGKAQSGGSLGFKSRGGTVKHKLDYDSSDDDVTPTLEKPSVITYSTIKGTRESEDTSHYGSSFILEDIRYVPRLRRSLISLGTLEKEGYTVKMQMGKIKVLKGCPGYDDCGSKMVGGQQPKEKTNMDCMVKEQEKVHLGIKVGANHYGNPEYLVKRCKGNVAEKKKVKESMVCSNE